MRSQPNDREGFLEVDSFEYLGILVSNIDAPPKIEFTTHCFVREKASDAGNRMCVRRFKIEKFVTFLVGGIDVGVVQMEVVTRHVFNMGQARIAVYALG